MCTPLLTLTSCPSDSSCLAFLAPLTSALLGFSHLLFLTLDPSLAMPSFHLASHLPVPPSPRTAFAARLFPDRIPVTHSSPLVLLVSPSPVVSPHLLPDIHVCHNSLVQGYYTLHSYWYKLSLFVFSFPYSPVASPSPLTCPPGFLGSRSWRAPPGPLASPSPSSPPLSLPSIRLSSHFSPAPLSTSLLSCAPLASPHRPLGSLLAGPLSLRTSRVANP
jgi:hypothetical protein